MTRASRIPAEPMADTTPVRPADDATHLGLSVVLVIGLVVVHLLMAYSSSTLPEAVFDAIDGVAGQSLGLVAVSVLPAVPLAVVVLVRARTRALGMLALGVVVTEALLGHLRGATARRLLDAGDVGATAAFLDRTGWVLAALVPASIVLAWGLARRRGATWTVGIALAAAIGIALHALDLSNVAVDHPDRQAVLLALAYHVVPALVGGLVAWAVQVRTEAR